MKAHSRIDTQLRWHIYPDAQMWDRKLAVGPKGPAYEVDALAVLRAYVATVQDSQTAIAFVRRFGPPVAPEGGNISLPEMLKLQGALNAVRRQWQLFDARALRQRRDAAAAFGASPPPTRLLAARQEYISSFLAEGRLNVRMEWSDGSMVIRPNDLQSAMWLMVGERIALGDASIRCRRIGCENLATRWLANGNSLKNVYCSEGKETCRKRVERDAKLDRYKQLRGLNKSDFAKEARKLRSEEVL